MATARRVTAPLDAYVLHRYDWSETSLILDLFTRSKGRVTVAAKGAKRPYSQLRSVLLPFQRISASRSASRPRTRRPTSSRCARAEWAGLDATPVLPPARLFAGFYLNELLMKLLARGDAHPCCSTPTPPPCAAWPRPTISPSRSACARSSWCCSRRSACCPSSTA